jgi:hypothetical protein
MTSCVTPGGRSWERPTSTRSGTASYMTGCLPAASSQKSLPMSKGRPSQDSRAPRDLRVVWRSCSSRRRRFTTAASRTTGGCRSFLIP